MGILSPFIRPLYENGLVVPIMGIILIIGGVIIIGDLIGKIALIILGILCVIGWSLYFKKE